MIRCFNGMSSDRNVFFLRDIWLNYTKYSIDGCAAQQTRSVLNQQPPKLFCQGSDKECPFCCPVSLAAWPQHHVHPPTHCSQQLQKHRFGYLFATPHHRSLGVHHLMIFWPGTHQINSETWTKKWLWKTLSSSFSLNPFKLVSTLLYLYMIHLYCIHVK